MSTCTPSRTVNGIPKAPKSATMLPKKSKFLSLRFHFPPAGDTKNTSSFSYMRQSATAAASTTISNSHQLNSVPLDPQNQVEDRDNHEHENIAYFFSAADGGATTLTGLLDNATASSSPHSANNSCRPVDGEERAVLVRNALRSRERDSSEEKWVCYSEVVETKVKEEEVSSSVVDLRPTAADSGGVQRLSLKLDYDEILSAWSDKGRPLYIHAESSQIVPDISYDFHNCEVSVSNNAWEVPEIESGETRFKNGEDLKTGRREASMLRYKAKRQKRLFSKTIRYQVRKLNAEKRPRVKGRFVKRS